MNDRSCISLLDHRHVLVDFPPSPPPLWAPPNMPLPPLPTPKTRAPETPPARPKRDVSASLLPTPSSRSTSATSIASQLARHPQPIGQPPLANHLVNHLVNHSSPINPPDADGLQTRDSRTVSIGAFPQPPTGFGSMSGTPSPQRSPLLPPGSDRLTSIPTPSATSPALRTDGSESGPRTTPRSSSRASPRASALPTPTLGRKPSAIALRTGIVDSPLNLPSPPDSRPASAFDSPSTDATFFEDASPPGARTQTARPANLVLARTRSRISEELGLKSVRSKRSEMDVRDQRGNVTVSVRVRPAQTGAVSNSVSNDWTVDAKRSGISYNQGEGVEYRYDNVFAPSDDNGKVYDAAAKRLVRRVMEGYHGTVFAYGITGTGKTFSMQGTAQSPGIIPLAVTDIFSYIREHPSREFLLRVSYLEIYNERIYDLLSSNGTSQEEIKLREDGKRGVYAMPLKEEIVQSPTQLLRVISRGDLARRTSSTLYNARSSRSHAVVQIVVESRERTCTDSADSSHLPGGVLVSTLSLIDLAGSERAAEDKERRTEGSHINKSLLTLGTVISRLSKDDGKAEASDKKHLPYRDSKLTRLLQSALSGNSLISILCTVQLSSVSAAGSLGTGSTASDTLNTLVFASRAKNNIVSNARRNESHPAHKAYARALLDRYRAEIEELRQQLEEQNRVKDEVIRTEEEEERWLERERESTERHEEQMLEMQLARTALKERIGHLSRLILSSKSVGVNAGDLRLVDEPGSGFGSTHGGRQASLASTGSGGSSLLRPGFKRVFTPSPTVKSHTSPATTPQMAFPEERDDEVDELWTESNEASPVKQVQALQTDLADKNRYIATLERRLLEVRRTSRGRNSDDDVLLDGQGSKAGGSSGPGVRHQPKSHGMFGKPLRSQRNISEDSDNELAAAAAKDGEVAELRAKVDEQGRMLAALQRKLARRDERSNDTFADEVNFSRPNSRPKPNPSSDADEGSRSRHDMIRKVKSSSVLQGHGTRPSASSSTTGSWTVNFSRVTPVSVLSPTRANFPALEPPPDSGKSLGGGKGYDDMTAMLDKMIRREGFNINDGFDFGMQYEGPPPPPLLAAELR